jgi:lipopolysaccharide biosynthesis regulator YciM
MFNLSIKKIAAFFFSAFMLLAIAASVSAQGGVGSTRGLPETSGGSNMVQGHIYFPEGDPGGKRLRVSLESTDEAGKSTQSDGDGSFLFNSLKPGSYTITVDGGKDYDTARETIFFEGSHRSIVVPIHLRVKGAASAAFAGVPKAAVDAYKKAQELAQKDDHKKAVEELKTAVALAPNFALALNELGVEYMKTNQMEKAAETYEALLKGSPNDATAHLNLGIALYNINSALLAEKKTDEANQKLSEAEQHLRQALALKSAGPNAHYYLGLTMIRYRKYDEAQKEMEAAVANGGDNLALAHKYLGGLYMSAKRNKDAADQLEKYLQIDPKAKDAEQIRGTIKDLRSKQ